MGVGALGWSPGRSVEDGNEIGRVETESYPCIVHFLESLTCRYLAFRRKVKPGIPNPAGG